MPNRPVANAPYPQRNSSLENNPEHARFVESLRTMSHYKQNVHEKLDFKINPKGITIEGQKRNERIFLYIRRHWAENIGWMTRNFFYFVIPFLVVIGLRVLGVERIEFIGVKEIFIILTLYYSLIITNIVKDFFDWYFDPYIITNERVIHYEFNPFTRYIVQESMLESIQRIEEIAGGPISNLFGYGTLVLSIEGPQETIVLKNIPSATKVRMIISELSKIAKNHGHKY